MYRCMITNRNSRESVKLNKIVVETRPKQYKHWDSEAEEEWFSNGTEIVREVNASKEGVDIWNSWNESERQQFVASITKKGSYK